MHCVGTPGSGPGLSWRYGFVGNTGSLGVDINAGARGNTYPGQTVTCQSQRVIGMWAIQSGGTVGSSYTFLNGINQTIINASVGLTVGINTAGSSSVIGTGYSTYVHEVLHFNAELGRADIETITYCECGSVLSVPCLSSLWLRSLRSGNEVGNQWCRVC